MEHVQVTLTKEGLHIEGFPEAVKVIQIEGHNAKRIADLALHKSDLEFAAECLAGINLVPEKPPALRQGLWRSAIIHFIKCFGDNAARGQLSAKKIYKGKENALLVFEYFKNMRNKHFVHDENSYSQCIPGAILNRGDKPQKVERIVCFSMVTDTLIQDDYSNLHSSISYALAWVVREYDALCDIITNDLEAVPYCDLTKLPDLTCDKPKLEDIGKCRKTVRLTKKNDPP